MRYLVAFTLAVGLAALFSSLDAFERLYHFTREFEGAELDEIILSIPGLLLAAVFLLGYNALALRRENKARLQAEQEARDALERARQQEELKKTFLIQASHDLNSPISGLVGMLQTLANEPNPGKSERFLALALSSARSLKDIISSVLSFTELEHTDPTQSFEDFSPAELLESCLNRFRPLALAKQITLVGELAPDLPESIHSHRGIAQIILDNLMSNAVKFTDTGTVTARIGYRRDPQQLLLEVRDTGRGLSPEERDNIFSPFFSRPASRDMGVRGVGIGLSVVCDLLELLGGRIDVDSEPGHGSRFTATLPG